jgi:hypothetical protein
MRSLLCPDKNTRDCRNTPRYATINWPIRCGWDHDYQVREKGYPCRHTAVLSGPRALLMPVCARRVVNSARCRTWGRWMQ